MKIPGIMVVDAKSLYDNLTTTGGVPREKQVMIDLLAARELSETGAVKYMWVPTTHMLADILTKMMKPTDAASRFLRTGVMSLRPSEDELLVEQRKADLRRGQRQRRKEKAREAKQRQ